MLVYEGLWLTQFFRLKPHRNFRLALFFGTRGMDKIKNAHLLLVGMLERDVREIAADRSRRRGLWFGRTH